MKLPRLFFRKRPSPDTLSTPAIVSATVPAGSPLRYSHNFARDRREPAPACPNTFDPNDPIAADPRIKRAKVFEPSLCYFRNGFRWGEPAFNDPSLEQPWKKARLRVLFHLMQAVADSPWKQMLILRGSALLQAWLGDQARDPGDLDWVVDPPSLPANSPESADLIAALIQIGRTPTNEVGIIFERVIAEEIWTYDRAPGRRIVFPWKLPDLPGGTVQMDVVFQESFPSAKVMLPLANENGSTLTIAAASPEQSLAWKILWLHTDRFPQGKDLYDAVLLAEFTPLPAELLEATLIASPEASRVPFRLESILEWQVDWQNFQLEYPNVRGDLDEWRQRLITALGPTFPSQRLE